MWRTKTPQLTNSPTVPTTLFGLVRVDLFEVDKDQSVSSEGFPLASGAKDVRTIDIDIMVHLLEQSQTTVKESTDRHGKNRVTERIQGIRPSPKTGTLMQGRARPEPENRHRTGAGMDKNQRMKGGRSLCLLWPSTEYDSLLRNGFGGTVSSFDCLEGSIYSLD
jgi:hypothetical protein